MKDDKIPTWWFFAAALLLLVVAAGCWRLGVVLGGSLTLGLEAIVVAALGLACAGVGVWIFIISSALRNSRD